VAVTPGGWLEVDNAGTSMQVNGLTKVDEAGLSVYNGGVMRLPALRSYSTSSSLTWEAYGEGSLLDLSGVTNITVNGLLPVFSLHIWSGARVDLSGLISEQGPFQVRVSDEGSVASLAGRWDGAGESYNRPSITVTDGGRIEGGPSRLDSVSLYAGGNATWVLSNVTDVVISAGAAWQDEVVWEAYYPGAVLDLSCITNLEVSGQWAVGRAEAYEGGRLDLGGLVAVQGPLQAAATGTNSVLRVAGEWSNDGITAYRPQIAANDGGTLQALVTRVDNTDLYAHNGSQIVLSNVHQVAITTELYWTSTDAGSVLDLSSVTHVSVAVTAGNSRPHIAARDGGRLDLSGLADFSGPVDAGASGTNSLLRLAGRWNCVGEFYDPQILFAQYGGRVEGNLTDFVVGDQNLQLQAANPGSVLDLGAVKNITVDSAFSGVTIGAQSGGRVLLGGLMNMAGPVFARADDDNSQVVIGGGRWNDAGYYLNRSTLNAYGGGKIQTVLTNIDTVSLYAHAGAVLKLDHVTSASPSWPATWQAEGAGSVLDLTSVTNVLVTAGNAMNIGAENGGTLDLSRLLAFTGPVNAWAAGTNSLLRVAGRWSGAGEYYNSPVQSLSAFQGGRVAGTITDFLVGDRYLLLQATDANSVVDLASVIHIAVLSPVSHVDVQTRAGGQVILSGLQDMEGPLWVRSDGPESAVIVAGEQWHDAGYFQNRSDLRATGGGIIQSALTNLNTISLHAVDGAIMRLGKVTSVSPRFGLVWEAIGTGSKLDLSSITNITTTAAAGVVYVQALSGGEVNLGELQTVRGAIRVDAEGTNSLVTVAGSWSNGELPGSYQELTARAGGHVVARLAEVMIGNNIGWVADGANSQLDLSTLTNISLVGPRYSSIGLRVSAGGRADLSGLISVTGPLQARAEGPGSQLVVAGRWDGSALDGWRPYLQASDHAQVQALLTAVDTTDLLAEQGGSLSLSNVTRILVGQQVYWQATGTNSVLDLSRVTNVVVHGDAGHLYLYALQGGQVNLTGLKGFNGNVDFTITGGGSELDLTGLNRLVVQDQQGISFTVTDSGCLNLSGLTSIAGRNFSLLAQDAGSLIDLSSLTACTSDADYYASSLIVTNGASVLFSPQGYLLGNTYANTSAGDWAATDRLVLHGPPWQSYWIESLDLDNPEADWQFHSRVALTADSQALHQNSRARLAFRVRPFEASPAYVDMLYDGQQPRLVLFSQTGLTNTIETCPDATATAVTWLPWSGSGDIVMTNSFRLLPLEAAADMGYFRARTH